MKKIVIVLAVLIGVLLGSAATAAAYAAASSEPFVTSVKGNRADGFRVQWSNGARVPFPALATWRKTCRNFPTAVASVTARNRAAENAACRQHIATTGRWLAEMRRALRHAN